jgi:phosphoglycolate phosphatase
MVGGEFKVAVFDHDDTLKITRADVYGQMVALGRKYDLEITNEALDASWGKAWEEQLELVYGDVANVEELEAAYEALGTDFPCRANEDSGHVLDVLDHGQIPRGIVSSHNGRMVREELKLLGFDPDDFTFVHGSEDTEHHKPDSRTFDPAAAYLEEKGISREQTVYIGDDVRDHEAAVGAGWGFVAVTTGIHTRDHFEEIGAIAVPRLTEAVKWAFPEAYNSYMNIRVSS